MIREDEVIKIGQLGKPHGVKGEISFSFTTDVWDRSDAKYLILLMDGIMVPFFIEEYRFRGEHSALLKFIDLDSVEAVQELVGVEVYIEKSQIEDLSSPWEGDMLWSYFEGFRIVDAEAGDLGKIIRVEDSTVNTLFELQSGLLIPAVEDFISEIDHERGIVRMHLPEGLVALNEK